VALPIRAHLRDIRLVNYRSEPVSAELRLDADGETAFRSTADLRPNELIHLSCEWPETAWSYTMAVRIENRDEWEAITWDGDGDLCKKIAIVAEDRSYGPVSFFESPGCPSSIERSCE
jgi:hypothetical protein